MRESDGGLTDRVMGRQEKTILLVNPWIYDFAAYDLWARPLGLLFLGGYLRRRGDRVFLIDCLDAQSPWIKGESPARPRRNGYGCGKFFKETVQKPSGLTCVPRRYSRYGIPETAFSRALGELGRPDLVLVTSFMTYWYPGPFRVVEVVKKVFPGTPVILGGIYATLCHAHAVEKSGADVVFSGGTVRDALGMVDKVLDREPAKMTEPIYPVFDLYDGLRSVCVATSRGCPYRCVYCASWLLSDGFKQREPEEVVDEIRHWVEGFGVTDIAFTDDALLVNSRNHLIPILEGILQRGLVCRYHLPNAIHARKVNAEIARLMFRMNFRTIRLGLETVDPLRQVETGGKVVDGDVERAVDLLRSVGFSRRDIGVYVMAGLPGQTWEDVESAIDKVWEWGGVPKVAEYSPIPGTALWKEAVRCSRYDIEGEPLFQNNSVFPCEWEGFSRESLAIVKARLQRRIRETQWEENRATG